MKMNHPNRFILFIKKNVLAVNYLSDTGVTDLDMDPDFDTIFFHVSALPCNLNAAITAYAAILKYKQL